MTIKEKSFTIELTEKEIEYITDSLHIYRNQKKEESENKTATPQQRAAAGMDKSEITVLRNLFASLLHRSYMGIDA